MKISKFFNFDTPLDTFPDLTGLVPDTTKLISAVNFWNPDNILSTDTFGVGLAPDFAARFSGLLQIPVAGIYTFTLGVDDGARLTIDGTTVVEVVDNGGFIEGSGAIDLPAGSLPIEIEYFQSDGNAELQLSFVGPGVGIEAETIVPPSALLPTPDPFTAITDVGGLFSITDVPTNLGDIVASATAIDADGSPLFGGADSVPPVAGGITDVGQITLIPGFPNGNGGFETGDFTGFTVGGEVAVITGLGPLTPPEGQFMAFLSTGDAAQGGATSTITTDPFRIPAGVDFLTLDFNFLSDEFPDFVGDIFDDRLVVRLNTSAGAEETILASVNTSTFIEATGTDFNGMTGFATIQLDVSSLAGMPEPCTLTFEIQVTDVGDTAVDSAGLIDNLRFE